MEERFIAVDLGATKMLTAVVDGHGNIIERVKTPTLRQRSPEEIIAEMAGRMANMIAQHVGPGVKLGGAAAAVPGPLRVPGGIIENSPNLGWHSVPLQQELRQRLGIEVVVEKDTNMAALGVQYFDNPGHCNHLLYITISSGIGSGIIAGGKIYRGSRGGAGEIGHMVVRAGGDLCECGRRGCLEAEASGIAMARKAEEMLKKGKAPTLKKYCPSGTAVSAESVGVAARQGDADALQLIEQAADDIATGIANAVNLVNPDAVILGGGVILGMQDLMLDRICDGVYRSVFPLHAESLEIRVTRLGEDIGIWGCVAAIKQAAELRQSVKMDGIS